MKTKLTTCLSLLACLGTASLLSLSSADAAIPGMKLIRLGNAARVNYQNLSFGRDVALTDLHAVVVEQGTTGIMGRVHVFDAVTGSRLRILTPTGAPYGNTTLSSLAAENRHAVVGLAGYGSNDPGCAFLFDLATGKQLGPIKASDGAKNNHFGAAVALHDNWIIVGAPGANDKGAVYVFDRRTGAQLYKMTAPSGVTGDRFGEALHAAQGMVAVGAPERGSGAGALYLADLRTGSISSALACPQSGKEKFGGEISGAGRRFLVSSRNTGSSLGPVYRFNCDGTWDSSPALVLPGGATSFSESHDHDGNLTAIISNYDLHLFDVTDDATNQLLFTIARNDMPTDIMRCVALGANRILIGAPDEDLPGANSAGAAYLLSVIPQPGDMAEAAAKGDPGADAPGTVYSSLHQAVINDRAQAAVISTLSGPASNAGKDTGVWLNLQTSWEELVSKSRDDQGGGIKAGTASGLIFNHNDHAVFQSSLTGTGITTFNNRVLAGRDYWGAPITLMRTGVADAQFSGKHVLGIRQTAQSHSQTQTAVAYTFRTGIANVTGMNDSGLVLINNTSGSYNNIYHEGASVVALPGVTFGQFHPRIGMSHEHYAYATALSGPVEANAAVFSKHYTANSTTVIARKGSTAAGASPSVFSSFFGEATSRTGQTLLRATISGGPATTATNEGLWLHSVSLAQLARKGGAAPFIPGAVFSRFLHAAPLGGSVLVHAALSGPGITTANNEAIYLYQGITGWVLLVRKGSSAPGCKGATVASIQGLEVDPDDDDYAILVGLGGTSAARNQALLRGEATAGPGGLNIGARRPFLVLRKGTLYQAGYGSSIALTSIALPHGGQSKDATGIGGKGLATLLRRNGGNPSRIVTRLTFNDGTMRLITTR